MMRFPSHALLKNPRSTTQRRQSFFSSSMSTRTASSIPISAFRPGIGDTAGEYHNGGTFRQVDIRRGVTSPSPTATSSTGDGLAQRYSPDLASSLEKTNSRTFSGSSAVQNQIHRHKSAGGSTPSRQNHETAFYKTNHFLFLRSQVHLHELKEHIPV
jgi:hypothetical protein